MSTITDDRRGSSSDDTGEEEVQQEQQQQLQNHFHGPSMIDTTGSTSQQQLPIPLQKKRDPPGTTDPNAEVIALSPRTLMATNRFICEICNKGFQRDQNLQLHLRGHNLPSKLKQRTSTEIQKRVYICPETTCQHHNPSQAFEDLTVIKKHFSRKHRAKKWECDKCSKKYAVESDWEAHSKTCGTREYKCDCGTIFSRRDSFICHRVFCDALAEENNKGRPQPTMGAIFAGQISHFISSMPMNTPSTNASVGMSEFNQIDLKNPLKSNPQYLMAKGLSAGSMFSSSSGILYNDLNSFSSLQLSPNNSSRDHDHLQSHQSDQAQPVGIDGGGFISPFVNNYKGKPEMTPQFMKAAVGTEMDMGLFSGLFMTGSADQHHGFLKNTEPVDSSTNNATMLQVQSINSRMGYSGIGRGLTRESRFGTNSGGHVITRDFLGVGGRTRVSLQEQQNHSQDEEDVGFHGQSLEKDKQSATELH